LMSRAPEPADLLEPAPEASARNVGSP